MSSNFLSVSSLSVAQGSSTGNPRNKTALQPGYSLMDWIRLTKSGQDLSGTKGKILQVTLSELSRHKTQDDCWMAINGMVFNVSAYMKFHPGGIPELMKGAGKDATHLFNDVHRWVNYESMLAKCLIGKLTDDKITLPSSQLLLPPPPPVKKSVLQSKSSSVTAMSAPPEYPNVDIYQTDETFVISVFTKRKYLNSNNVICTLTNDVLTLTVRFYQGNENTIYVLEYLLGGDIKPEKLNIKTSGTTGKIEISLLKEERKKWLTSSVLSQQNYNLEKKSESYSKMIESFSMWNIHEVTQVTHDVISLVLKPPKHLIFYKVPIGHHITLKAEVMEDTVLERKYTPVYHENEDMVRLLIKVYDNGAMTPYINKLKINDEIMVGDIHEGTFDINSLNNVHHLYLLAAGTGITPMSKIILSQLNNLVNEKIILLFFNKTSQDIIWKETLTQLSSCYHKKLIFANILSREDSGSPKGRISYDVLKGFIIPPPSNIDKNKKALVCGNIPFSKLTEKILKENFYFKSEEIHLFEG